MKLVQDGSAVSGSWSGEGSTATGQGTANGDALNIAFNIPGILATVKTTLSSDGRRMDGYLTANREGFEGPISCTRTSSSGSTWGAEEILLQAIRWTFKRGDGHVIGRNLRLLPGGKVGNYEHKNENTWAFLNGTLIFYDESGNPTTKFTTASNASGHWVLKGGFLGRPKGITHVLEEAGRW